MNKLCKLKIIEIYGYMDGGTVEVTCQDEENKLIKIEFIQKVNFKILEEDKLPGRIYLNNVLVQSRSFLENEILERLKETKNKDSMLLESIEYVKSDKYISDQSKIKLLKRK